MEETPTPPPAAPPTTDAMQPSDDDRTMALVAHLLGIFTQFLGALIIWLIKKDASPFIDDQAKEALNFQITMIIAALACIPLAFVTLGFGALLAPVVGVVNIVFCIIAAIESQKGVRYRYPICLRLIT